jgi:hypothetical protein
MATLVSPGQLPPFRVRCNAGTELQAPQPAPGACCYCQRPWAVGREARDSVATPSSLFACDKNCELFAHHRFRKVFFQIQKIVRNRT